MNYSIIGYDAGSARIREAATAEELLEFREPGKINWLNVEDLSDKDGVQAIARAFGIHPLTVEDILDTEQRPKTEEFDDYIFITFKALNRSAPAEDGVRFEQISMVLKGSTVLTFQELSGDSFDGIRKRILNNAGRIRKMGPDYLAYAILDVVVNDYSHVLDTLGERIEEFEGRAIDAQDKNFIADIQTTRQSVLRLRRIIGPLREALSLILHMEPGLIQEVTVPFFKDVHDEVIQCEDAANSYRELLAGVMEVNLSTMSNRMNSVMKVLTIISTIFIPLTFIVGVYGMNFRNMPELELSYGYPAVWGVMAAIVVGMIAFFKKRRWL
ncbi:MAG: cobalt/magnesium transport protein CorA [Treponematales bacterium]